MDIGLYVENNNNSYWKASLEQVAAIHNLNKNYMYRYTGMGSSYWINHDKAIINNVKGLKNKYTFVITANSGIFIKTSDGKLRHVFEVEKPPKPLP
jgi:hypothetical protein